MTLCFRSSHSVAARCSARLTERGLQDWVHWRGFKGVAVQAMDAIKSGAIQWERNAMTIRQFENEIDNILGGVHRRHQKPDPQAAAFKQMMDDLGDYAFQETQTVTIPSTATRRLS